VGAKRKVIRRKNRTHPTARHYVEVQLRKEKKKKKKKRHGALVRKP